MDVYASTFFFLNIVDGKNTFFVLSIKYIFLLAVYLPHSLLIVPNMSARPRRPEKNKIEAPYPMTNADPIVNSIILALHQVMFEELFQYFYIIRCGAKCSVSSALQVTPVSHNRSRVRHREVRLDQGWQLKR